MIASAIVALMAVIVDVSTSANSMGYMTKIKHLIPESDPRLKAVNRCFESPLLVWPEIQENVKKMFKIMYATGHGVGLAAPQVGWNAALFIMNPDSDTKKPQAQRIFWNPLIAEKIGEPVVMKEGCLSRAGVYGRVIRYPSVRMEAYTPSGLIRETFTGFAAQIVQHEVDHLFGILCFEKFIKE